MDRKTEEPDVMKLYEASKFLRINQKTLSDMVDAGTVPARRVGRILRFSRKELEAWLAGKSTQEV